MSMMDIGPPQVGKDPLIDRLTECRNLIIDIEECEGPSRALEITLQQVETALLWREQDLRWRAAKKPDDGIDRKVAALAADAIRDAPLRGQRVACVTKPWTRGK